MIGGGAITQAALAQEYFNNKRVPAAVLAAMCIQDIFALQRSPPPCMKSWDAANDTARSLSWRTLRYAYLLLMVLSFSLLISTVFVSTQVSTQLATNTWRDGSKILGGNPSLVAFLITEFEFEYVMVRCHFLMGLLSFVYAQALRVRYALRKYKSLAISGMCCLLTAASGMIAYQNEHTVSYGGTFGLIRRNWELSIGFLLRNDLHKRPMGAITLVCFVLTIFHAMRGWFAPEFVDSRYAYSEDY